MEKVHYAGPGTSGLPLCGCDSHECSSLPECVTCQACVAALNTYQNGTSAVPQPEIVQAVM